MAHKRLKNRIAAIPVAGALILTCLLCACKHVHNLVFVEGVAATCESRGTVAHWECGCGKYFSDEAGEHELSEDEIIEQRKSHVFSEIGFNDTAHYLMCAECGFVKADTESEHILKYYADNDGHYRYCYYEGCAYQTPYEPHVRDEGEDFCSVCHYHRPIYELSKDGTFYIVSGTSMPFKEDCEEITIPDTYLDKPVKEIGERAFSGCVKLKSVTFGANVITVGDHAFMGCKSLTGITFNDKLLEINSQAFYDCAALEEVSLPSGLKILGNGAFRGCKALKSVSIPESVTEILTRTFYECSSLKSLRLHDKITKIELAAFSQSGITEFTFPSRITEIPMTVFLNCPDLERVVVPAGVTSIGMSAFDSCPSLKTLRYLGTAEQWENVEKGNMWNKNSDFTVEFA